MPAHHRLRSRSSSSSGSDSDSDSDSPSEGSDDGRRHHEAHEDGGDEDERPRERRRKGTSTLFIAAFAVLFLAAVGLAAWLYLRRDARSASASAAEEVAAGETKATTGGTGGTAAAGAGDSAGGGSAGGTAKSTSSPPDSSLAATAGGASVGSSSSSSGRRKTAAPASDSPSPSTSLAAAAPSSSASPSPSPAASTSSKSCKKGVGYNDAKFTTQLSICWAYDWSSAGGAGLREGAMYVPILWGPKQLDGWTDNAKKAIAAGATHVLGFNEPDLPEQANLSPALAAQLWKDHVEPLAGSAKLVSPAVTNGLKLDNGTSMGVPWLKEFLDACAGCTVDAVALHWYDSAGNTAYFTSYLEDAHSTLNKPIWLTEFMGTGTPDEQKTFVEFAVPWLEKQDWIERYAAFGDFLDNPVAEFIASDDGSLNDLGKAYSNAK